MRLVLCLLALLCLGLPLRAETAAEIVAANAAQVEKPSRQTIAPVTFGIGIGIGIGSGIAGIGIGLYAKVTSEPGTDYIVQSFMTVVVGGVGNIWGTLAGATMIGGLQKMIEGMNPSKTLAAQTYMILFIQFRPRGIIALRGRAAGD